MKSYTLASLMFVLPAILYAQKTIRIHDELNSTQSLRVKMGVQAGKVWKLKFGEYAVTRGAGGWEKTSSKGNFFGTKTESVTTSKFSFDLANAKKDVANVNAETMKFIREKNSFQLGDHFGIGEDKVLQAEDNFAAFMHLNGDTSVTWGLFLNVNTGAEATNKTEGFLTNKERKIEVTWVNSLKPDQKAGMPAMGYEFTEAGKPLSAVQYYGGGLLGMNKIFVWLHPNNDEQTNLILAAAMAAILQVRAGGPAD